MDKKNSKNTEKKTGGIGRRDVLKSLATFPFAGALLYGAFRKQSLQHYRQGRLLKELGLSPVNEPVPFNPVVTSGGDQLRIGIIGFGIRGEQLLRSAGFAHPEMIDSWTEAAAQNRADDRLQVYLDQEDLNIRITGVCDIFRAHTRRALETSANLYRTDTPLLTYTPGREGVDVVTSATEQYFASRGLLYTYRGGRRVDTTFLHIKEWVDAIRGAGKTSCDIKAGVEEAIAAHMGTQAYRLETKVFWDKDKKEIVTA